MCVTRTAPSEAQYICFRNSCGVRGHLWLHSTPEPAAANDDYIRKDGAYTGPLTRLSDDIGSALQNAYELPRALIERNFMDAGYPWLAMPIRASDGTRTAWQLRWSWLVKPAPVPKSKLFLEGERRTLAWYPPGIAWEPASVLLVEDCLSALRASYHGRIATAALLGTQLTANHVQELHAAGTAHIVLALDPDALETAFELARRWGPAFKSFRVLAIENDLKDMQLDKLKQLLAGI